MPFFKLELDFPRPLIHALRFEKNHEARKAAEDEAMKKALFPIIHAVRTAPNMVYPPDGSNDRQYEIMYEDGFDIIVRNPDGWEYPIQIRPSDSIRELQDKIAWVDRSAFGEEGYMRMVFDGKVMMGMTCEFYGLEKGSLVRWFWTTIKQAKLDDERDAKRAGNAQRLAQWEAERQGGEEKQEGGGAKQEGGEKTQTGGEDNRTGEEKQEAGDGDGMEE